MDPSDHANQFGEDDPAPDAWADPAVVLAFHTLRELDDRFPGFQTAVQQRVLRHAAALAASEEPETAALAPSVRSVAEGWMFEA